MHKTEWAMQNTVYVEMLFFYTQLHTFNQAQFLLLLLKSNVLYMRCELSFGQKLSYANKTKVRVYR